MIIAVFPFMLATVIHFDSFFFFVKRNHTEWEYAYLSHTRPALHPDFSYGVKPTFVRFCLNQESSVKRGLFPLY